MPHRIELGGIDVDAVTCAQCIEHIFRALDGARGGMVVRPTLDHLRQCSRDREFAKLINRRSDRGGWAAAGVASRLQGTPLPGAGFGAGHSAGS